MMKSFLLIILTLVLGTSVMAKSSGSFKMLTHEQYVHLSDKQKDDYHVMIMELMAELESQYKLDTRTFGYSKSRFEKFQKAITDLQNIFISSAYAARNKTPAQISADWARGATEFGSLSTRAKVGDGNCVFAGWVSRVKGSVCLHPMAAELNPNQNADSAEAEFKAYPRDPDLGCNQAQMRGKYIQCNPLIFGYENPSSGKLFCVSTDNLAENSSYQCMKLALSSGNTDQRLRDLRSRYSANASAFNNVSLFNVKTCICPTAPNDSYSTRYQNHIRPQIDDPDAAGKFQACFGLMKMMDKSLIDCTPPDNLTISPETREIFSSFRTFMQDKNTSSGRSASNEYKSFIQSNLQTGSASAAYASFCAATPRQEEPEDEPVASTCSVACVDKAGAEADSNTRKSNAVLSCSVSEIKVPNAERQLTAVVNPVLASMQIPEAKPAAGQSPAIAITFTGDGIATAQSASCTATYPQATVPQTGTPTCKATCTFTPASAEGVTPVVAESKSCTISELKLGDQVIDSGQAAIVEATVSNGQPVSATYTPASGPASSIQCDTNWGPGSGGGNEEMDNEDGPSITISKAQDGENKFKVTATASNANGWSIKLIVRSPGTETPPGDVTVSDSAKTSFVVVSQKPEVFKVCAELRNTTEVKKPPENDGCVDIPKIGTTDAPTDGKSSGGPVNVPKMAPPQAPFMRNGADTSARGIK